MCLENCQNTVVFLARLSKALCVIRIVFKHMFNTTGRMMEFCTAKRMVVLVIALIVVCIIFLGVENALTEDYRISAEMLNLTGREFCWKSENFSIKEECRECTDFEKKSGHSAACAATGFKELIICSKSGEIFRSCPRSTWIERRNFWLFESTMFALGLVSWTVVYFRHKQLDHRVLERIQKQIAAGV
ncbi:hypothetical protein CHUAL_011050 [Chamberlinius hualienensis]